MVIPVGNPGPLTAVLDVATTLTSKARIPTRHDRERTWYTLLRTANEDLDPGLPSELLEEIYRILWRDPRESPEFADQPWLRVRALQVDALADPGAAVHALTSAASLVGTLPDADDQLGRDAALRVVAGQVLQLNDDVLREAGPTGRVLLSETLMSAAGDSAADVRQLAEATRTILVEGPAEPPLFGAQIDVAQRAFPHAARSVTSRLDQAIQRRMLSADLSRQSPAQALSNLAILPILTQGSRTWPSLPQPEPDQFNVGLAAADAPGVALRGRSLKPDRDYLVWASVGPPDPEALPDPMGGLDLSRMLAGDLLEVVLFRADGTSTSGTLLLGSGRPLQVAAPADDAAVADELRQSRLYFRVRTAAEPGQTHLRLCLYHHNTLLRVHHLVLTVGRETARFRIGTPYAIATSPTGADVGQLAQRRLSVYTNSPGDGTHGFYFQGVADKEPTRASTVFDSNEVTDLLRTIRGGLRLAAWGSSGRPRAKAYKYPRGTDGTFGTVDGLRDDLILLARRGYNAWEEITSRFVAADRRSALQQLMRAPGGLVDIAPRDNSRFVPPLATLYDYDLDTGRHVALDLCPEAEDALRGRTPLLQTACFGADGCRYAAPEVVCPSGFWGLRHEIGVPLSDSDDVARPRLVIGAGAPRSALIGTVPESVVAGVTDHARHVMTRLPGSVHVTDRDTWFVEAARPTKYPILYFLCHGGRDDDGGPLLVLDKLGRAGISKSNLTARHVALGHRPLVVMNACDSAALEPDKAISLVRGFTYNGAGAVIGTETAIFPSLAYAFADAFLDGALTAGSSLGAALRSARLELLRLGNPLGLAYILYGLPDARLG